ncbi:unnamed protein product [Arabidopsis halleri]
MHILGKVNFRADRLAKCAKASGVREIYIYIYSILI